MKVKFTLTAFLATVAMAFAQDTPKLSPLDTLTKNVNQIKSELDVLKRLKVTGYIQPQYQQIDSAGAASFAAGSFAPNVNSRFMMRRGRIKFTYTSEDGLAQFVLQPDITEKGVFIRETYAKFTDPWTKWLTGTIGLNIIPFGHDIIYSSSLRETPERARVFQTIFPTERDLGAFLTIQPWKTSKLKFLRLDFGYMNGSGVASEFDSHKDVTARFSINKANKAETFKIGFGISILEGAWREGRKTEYSFGKNTAGDDGFIAKSDTANYTKNAKREYLGADLQISIDQPVGLTTIRAEYIQGQQPGTSSGSTSFAAAPAADIFIRQFSGASFYLIQNILKSKWQIVVKYDWYDPNTKLAGDQIGKSATNTKSGDVKYTTTGFGINYRWNGNVKITAYYDMVKNEITKLSGFTHDLPDNVFTFRVQYKF